MKKLKEEKVNKAYEKLETAMFAFQEEVLSFKNAFPNKSSCMELDNVVSVMMGALEDVDSDITAHFATR